MGRRSKTLRDRKIFKHGTRLPWKRYCGSELKFKKPQKKLEIYSNRISMDYKKNVSNIIIKYLYEKKHFFILARIRK